MVEWGDAPDAVLTGVVPFLTQGAAQPDEAGLGVFDQVMVLASGDVALVYVLGGIAFGQGLDATAAAGVAVGAAGEEEAEQEGQAGEQQAVVDSAAVVVLVWADLVMVCLMVVDLLLIGWVHGGGLFKPRPCGRVLAVVRVVLELEQVVVGFSKHLV